MFWIAVELNNPKMGLIIKLSLKSTNLAALKVTESQNLATNKKKERKKDTQQKLGAPFRLMLVCTVNFSSSTQLSHSIPNRFFKEILFVNKTTAG